MNYLDVVLNGYFNDNNREHLEKYFFREFKKAEKEQFFDTDEFFSGCQKVIQIWEKHLQDEVYKRQHELYKMLSGAKNKTICYSKIKGKTIEQQRRETIEYCEKELKDVRPDGIGSISFKVHLMSLTNGRIAYNLPYNEVLFIKDAIENAFQKAKNKNEPMQPEQKKDKNYSLINFLNEQVKNLHYYKSFKSQIDINGCFQIKTDSGIIKVYTPELTVILTSTDLEAIDHDTQKEIEINSKEYLKTYIEAYHLGEQYFDAEIKVSPNILYGANAEQYVRDIHLNYFHTEHRAGQEGWVFVKRSFPFILNNKLIYDYGYYSGIVNKVDEQVKKYPQLFETFDKCEHKQPPQQIQDEGLNEITEQNNLTISTIEDWLFEFKAQKILNETNYTVLVNALSHYFEKGVFPKLENEIKVGRVNKKLFGWNLNRIFYSEGKGVEIELLRFAKSNISIFKDVNFDENNIRKSNLYKYFTTKTK